MDVEVTALHIIWIDIAWKIQVIRWLRDIKYQWKRIVKQSVICSIGRTRINYLNLISLYRSITIHLAYIIIVTVAVLISEIVNICIYDATVGSNIFLYQPIGSRWDIWNIQDKLRPELRRIILVVIDLLSNYIPKLCLAVNILSLLIVLDNELSAGNIFICYIIIKTNIVWRAIITNVSIIIYFWSSKGIWRSHCEIICFLSI